MNSHEKPKVAVLFRRVGPYHFARLKAAASLADVTVVEFSNVDPTYAWDLVDGKDGFERLMLFSGIPEESQSASQVLEAVNKALSDLRPAVVAVPGWNDRCSLAALRWCIRHAVPAIVMSETTAWDEKRKKWRELVKKRVVGLCSVGLVGGGSHADYLAVLGMAPVRIFLGYDVVDNDYFGAKVVEIQSRKAQTRDKFGLPEKYFLASARFVEKKNLVRLLQGYARYRELAAMAANGKQRAEVWNLVLLGDGPLRPTLNSQLSALNLHDHVLLPGFKQYDQLPAYYALANTFIHASTTEPWGLVVNEAMASGVPVLVSNRCGCAKDLVQEGVNGFTFDPYSVNQIADSMLRMAIGTANGISLKSMGDASYEIIRSWGPSRFAKGLHSAVETAMKHPCPKINLMDQLLLSGLIRL